MKLQVILFKISKGLEVKMHAVQVNSRPILPGAAMFEAAQAAGASLGAHSPLPKAALQHAAIPTPLMLQRPQVPHRIVSSHASMPTMGCSLPLG
jgi:diketogulonate reductase-like aldo/keto reductase